MPHRPMLCGEKWMLKQVQHDEPCVDMTCQSCHALHVIKSFATRATERFAREGKSKFSGMDVAKAFARLQVLQDRKSVV